MIVRDIDSEGDQPRSHAATTSKREQHQRAGAAIRAGWYEVAKLVEERASDARQEASGQDDRSMACIEVLQRQQRIAEVFQEVGQQSLLPLLPRGAGWTTVQRAKVSVKPP